MTITVFTLLVLLLSIMLHEIAHGAVAYWLGDPTAKHAGRLTLNPIKHLDPFGSIILPLLLLIATMGRGPIFGWAKPVPINPYNLKDQKWGELKVSIAGPAANFFIAVIFGLIIRFISLPEQLFAFFSIIVIYNFLWGIFNLVPIPPLDGSHILFSFIPSKYDDIRASLEQYGFLILIFFIFFGLPIVFVAADFLYSLITGLTGF